MARRVSDPQLRVQCARDTRLTLVGRVGFAFAQRPRPGTPRHALVARSSRCSNVVRLPAFMQACDGSIRSASRKPTVLCYCFRLSACVQTECQLRCVFRRAATTAYAEYAHCWLVITEVESQYGIACSR